MVIFAQIYIHNWSLQDVVLFIQKSWLWLLPFWSFRTFQKYLAYTRTKTCTSQLIVWLLCLKLKSQTYSNAYAETDLAWMKLFNFMWIDESFREERIFFPLQLGLGQGWNRKKLAPESLRERRVVLLEPGGTQWSEGFSLRILSHI